MKLIALLTAGALAAGALGAAPADAQRHGHNERHGEHGFGHGGYGVRRGHGGYGHGYGFQRRYYGYGGVHRRGFYGPRYGCRRFGYYHHVRRCFY